VNRGVEYRAGDEMLTIGIPARIIKEKNQLYVIKELASQDFTIEGVLIKVHLYGELDDLEYFAEISEYFSNSNVCYKEKASLETIYNECELIVLPSLYEGTSNVLLEAMISEKDFLCSSIRANRSVPVNALNLFEGEVGGFLRALSRFLLAEERENEFARASNLKVAVDCYSATEYERNILQLLVRDGE
jgi:glycosyltransferase involved in cell wall biosynthesis